MLLSLVLYVGELGFYSDDYDFLRVMALAPDQSIAGSFAALNENPNILPRPVQSGYQAVLFALFGVEPLGYHLVHALLLLAMTLLLYLALRELRVPRLMAVVVPALFAVSPSYSSDRFWFAASGYALAMATCFLSLYAELRTVRPPGAPRWRWKAVALVALLASGLGFEIALPFLALNVLLMLVQARRLHGPGALRRLGRFRLLALVGPNLVALVAIMAYKASTSPGTELSQSIPGHLRRLFGGATLVNFGSYGIGMPQAASWGLGAGGAAVLLIGGLAAAGAFAYVWHLHGNGPGPVSRRGWLRFALAGVAVFLLGYGVFLTTSRFVVTSTGIGNRWQIAGAVGAAMVVAGIFGWLSSLLAPGRIRRGALSGMLAMMIGSSVLVTNALATQWTSAGALQEAIVDGITERVPSVAPETTFILDGVCPYRGSAIVFDSDWDLAGALRLHYGDASLHADVATTGRMQLREDGLVAYHYGRETIYPYGAGIFAYDHAGGRITPLTEQGAARRALGGPVPRFAATCPAAGEGRGVPILPLDRRFGTLGG